MSIHADRAEALRSCFRGVFGCRGREFGSLSRGVSDGVEGVQWNAGYRTRDGTARLGVNREGMKYDDWPVARLIERGAPPSAPLDPVSRTGREAWEGRRAVDADAWQAQARPPIRERYLDPTPLALDRFDEVDWADALRGARDCLDPSDAVGAAGWSLSRCSGPGGGW